MKKRTAFYSILFYSILFYSILCLTSCDFFNNCTKLKELIFNASTFHLSNTMFDGCSSLDRLTIYGNVINWPSGIFSNCGHLGLIDFMKIRSVILKVKMRKPRMELPLESCSKLFSFYSYYITYGFHYRFAAFIFGKVSCAQNYSVASFCE
ncbi:MAG: leucine-rich repeat domain-containing protein [Treponema sp.]|nr:leucine-rich repeat domain-containing protein [Treponema sp.]